MQSAVEIHGLSVSIDQKRILSDITADIAARTIVGLLGPSGAGKTTLIRAILGLLRVDAGQVTVLGKPAGSPSLRSEIGYVTQAPSVNSDLTVIENVSYFAALLKVGDGDMHSVINKVGLDPVLRQRLWKPFRELAAGGTAILVSSHVMDEADKCDVLIFMRGGGMLIADTKKNVFKKTKSASMEDAFLRLAEGAPNGS
ncbi:MAG TPA: ATP-binding cassette domain-containing protein [Candidatus Saccharimonadales bacterium]|jgi:ABC-2 type transport system ATP-binding protein